MSGATADAAILPASRRAEAAQGLLAIGNKSHPTSRRFRLFLPRLEVFGQALKPHHQRWIALDLDVFVLNTLHERKLLVLRVHGGEAVGAVLEADGEC